MEPASNTYNAFASEYADMMAPQEQAGVRSDTSVSRFLQVVGDVAGLAVLDAGCGEGYLARILAHHGAQVTGIDISPRLIEIAHTKALADQIDYQVHDLSQPLPEYQDHFDLVTSYFVLNDVEDYQGFLTTLGSVLKPGGRLVLFLNNPYSFVLRGHIIDYFASGAFPYRGMADQGVKVHFYQRTLEQYLDACFEAGLRLQRLVDVPTPDIEARRRPEMLIPEGYQFPFFMILSLVKV